MRDSNATILKHHPGKSRDRNPAGPSAAPGINAAGGTLPHAAAYGDRVRVDATRANQHR